MNLIIHIDQFHTKKKKRQNWLKKEKTNLTWIKILPLAVTLLEI